MSGKSGKVFPPSEYETVDNKDSVCYHVLHVIEIDVEKFRIERICNNCLCTLESETFSSLKQLLLDSHDFIDNAIYKAYVVSESAG